MKSCVCSCTYRYKDQFDWWKCKDHIMSRTNQRQFRRWHSCTATTIYYDEISVVIFVYICQNNCNFIKNCLGIFSWFKSLYFPDRWVSISLLYAESCQYPEYFCLKIWLFHWASIALHGYCYLILEVLKAIQVTP